MEKFKQLKKIKEIYSRGENMIKYLKSIGQNKSNSLEDILISYDFQAGAYVKSFSKKPDYKYNYCGAIAQVIDQLDGVDSLMEVGVGEGTTLGVMLSQLKSKPSSILGFDISWSRVKFAQDFLNDFGQKDVKLFTGNLFEIPLADNSIDVVYTSHSIEPNGGKEKEALKELYRVAKKYVVLLEPSYELGSEDVKQRMRDHGYITELHDTAKVLNYNVIEHKLFEYCSNPLNPTGLMIIKKDNHGVGNSAELICPITHSELKPHGDSLLYSEDCFLAYPVIENIPCLLKENSILATHLKTDYAKFKDENNVVYEKRSS